MKKRHSRRDILTDPLLRKGHAHKREDIFTAEEDIENGYDDYLERNRRRTRKDRVG